MYQIRRVRGVDELRAFKAGYQENLAERSRNQLALSLPIEYLATSCTMGVFTGTGELIGGYVLRLAPPFRCLRAVPDSVIMQSVLLQSVPESKLCELTCIWRSRALPTTAFATRVWPRIIVDCVGARRKYILGLGFENRMNDTYQVWSPHRIYHGPSAARETQATVHIFAFSRSRIVANFLTNFLLLVPRKLLAARQRSAA